MAQRCVRYKRVPRKGGGTVRRCAKFSGRASNGRRRGYRKRRSGMARRGSHCRRWKRVRSKFGGTVRRCASYGGGRRRRRGGYRKGHVPFNKGRKCLRKGKVFSPYYNKRVTRCLWFGGRPRPGGTPLITPPPIGRGGPFLLSAGNVPGRPPPSRYAGR